MTRVQGFDLVRGAAVTLVILRHTAPGHFAGAGMVGVVMFFALSGYLITGSMITELDRTGTLCLRRFYRRRVVRLIPALVVMLAVLCLVTLVFDPLDDRAVLDRTVEVALSYTGDIPFAHGSPATFHLWTLAVEEQFYLVWPLLFMLAWTRRRIHGLLFMTFVLGSLACVAILVHTIPDTDFSYTLPTSYIGSLIIGASARVLSERSTSLFDHAARFAAPLAMLVLTVASAYDWRAHALTYPLGASALALLTVVILHAWREWQVVRSKTLRLVAGLGTLSYGAYIWDYPLTIWLRASMSPAAAGPIATVLTLIAAVLSWRYIEKPALHRWGRRRGRHKRTRSPVPHPTDVGPVGGPSRPGKNLCVTPRPPTGRTVKGHFQAEVSAEFEERRHPQPLQHHYQGYGRAA